MKTRFIPSLILALSLLAGPVGAIAAPQAKSALELFGAPLKEAKDAKAYQQMRAEIDSQKSASEKREAQAQSRAF